MKTHRSSGILLHPTSLPSRYGIGDFGQEAFDFVDFLSASKQTYWQVLPLGPPGKGNSPYNCLSAFAGNPLLISPQRLYERGYVSASDAADAPCCPDSDVDFVIVKAYKEALLRRAFERFVATDDYWAFETKNESWLNSFSAFMARKSASGSCAWTKIDAAVAVHPDEVNFHKFVQFEFFREWFELKRHCMDRKISIIGDLPFYVEHDSSDVWANRELFHLDSQGEPSIVGGVPPDYFSADGQLWGNPSYRWDCMERTGYQWWLERLQAALYLFDIVRLDHFRGYEAAWEVQSGETTAVHGQWTPVPGATLFHAAQAKFGSLPLIAENLGVITPQVEELRRQFSLPGMEVLQFAFVPDPTHRPHNYSRDTLACTGTHDNDTIAGWWNSRSAHPDLPDATERKAERNRASEYVGAEVPPVNWAFIRSIMTSPADLVIIPMQDILGLGNEARMNVPGTPSGNWRWRLKSGAILAETGSKLRSLTESSDRSV